MVDKAMNAMNTGNAERREKFTPAPWTVETRSENILYTNVFFRYGFRVIAESAGKRVCYSETDKKDNIDELNANAALIAAAPEMYEALKEIADTKIVVWQEEEMPGVFGESQRCDTCVKMKRIAKKALEKARGVRNDPAR